MYIYFSFIVDGRGIHLAELVSVGVVPAAKWSMEMRKYDCPRLLLEISQKLRGTVSRDRASCRLLSSSSVECPLLPEHGLLGTGDWLQLTWDDDLPSW